MGLAFALLQAGIVFVLGRRSGLWGVAVLLVVALELRGLWLPGYKQVKSRVTAAWDRMPGILLGVSATLIVALVVREATQIAVAALYFLWLLWRERDLASVSTSFVNLLIVQAAMFEAIFLMAAIWQTPSWVVIALVWAGAYVSVYGTLFKREDRSAGVMAATWGVIAAEVAWVLQLWLITYTMRGGYVLVPQPALILTALAYVFGSILTSSRQGILSRARLTEYLLIAVILVMIVVLGTSWQGGQ